MSITRGSLKYKVPLVISFLSTASVYKKNTPFVHGRCNLLSAHAYRQIFTFFVHVTAIAPGPIWHATLKDNGASMISNCGNIVWISSFHSAASSLPHVHTTPSVS